MENNSFMILIWTNHKQELLNMTKYGHELKSQSMSHSLYLSLSLCCSCIAYLSHPFSLLNHCSFRAVEKNNSLRTKMALADRSAELQTYLYMHCYKLSNYPSNNGCLGCLSTSSFKKGFICMSWKIIQSRSGKGEKFLFPLVIWVTIQSGVT